MSFAIPLASRSFLAGIAAGCIVLSSPRPSLAMCGGPTRGILYDVTVTDCEIFNADGAIPVRGSGLWLETRVHGLVLADIAALKPFADGFANQMGARGGAKATADFYLANGGFSPGCDALEGRRLHLLSVPPCCDTGPAAEPACAFRATGVDQLADIPRLEVSSLSARPVPLFVSHAEILQAVWRQWSLIHSANCTWPHDATTVAFAWHISPDGSVHDVDVTGTTAPDNTRWASCAQHVIAGWKFPPSETETVVPRYSGKGFEAGGVSPPRRWVGWLCLGTLLLASIAVVRWSLRQRWGKRRT